MGLPNNHLRRHFLALLGIGLLQTTRIPWKKTPRPKMKFGVRYQLYLPTSGEDFDWKLSQICPIENVIRFENEMRVLGIITEISVEKLPDRVVVEYRCDTHASSRMLMEYGDQLGVVDKKLLQFYGGRFSRSLLS